MIQWNLPIMVIVEPAFPPFPQLPLYRRELDCLWCCHNTTTELVRNSDHVFNYSMYKSIYVQTSYTGHEGGREEGRERGREEGRAWREYAPGVVKAHHSMVGLQQVS